MTYLSYLATDSWRRLAAVVKQHPSPPPQGECALCPEPATDVHHRTYVRLGHEWPSDLVPLCGRCHARHHGTFDECADRQLGLPLVVA